MKKIDLSDIKENDLDKTATFRDLMTKKERKQKDDLEEMLEEKRKSTRDLTKDLESIKKRENNIEDTLSKTQILDITRQMRFNMNEIKLENNQKKGVSRINIVGEVSILCILYYLYLLLFTNYQDTETNYMIAGGFIVLMVVLFGISVVTNKKLSKIFNIINILTILGFITFSIYTLI